MTVELRNTATIRKVIAALLRADADQTQPTGAEIIRETQMQSGTAYAILQRLVHERALTFQWVLPEDDDPDGQPRKLYRLTTEGREAGVALMERPALAPPAATYCPHCKHCRSKAR